MALIFSYGTLQEESIQLDTFGRVLEGTPDRLTGYESVSLTLTDPRLIATSGRVLHTNLAYRGDSECCVAGTCLSVADSELVHCDSYEDLAGYQRQLVTLASGKQVWVYTFGGRLK